LNFIDGPRPPILLVVGDKDGSLQVSGVGPLATRLRSHGNTVEERLYPGIGHMTIMLALAPGFRGLAPLREDIVRFVTAH
jgi:hypothetical protein